MSKLALLSVSDKTGLIEFARQLVEQFGFEIISSGGTASALKSANIPVMKVSDYTGAPEILGGRVKTLHPRIHGGILSRRDHPQDIQDMTDNQIRSIDLVVVNLYPFEETIRKDNITPPEAIEQIDIGGPAMIRAAAKNYNYLTILCDSIDYTTYLKELAQNNGNTSLSFRQKMAGKAFALTNRYDQAIANYFYHLNTPQSDSLPQQYSLVGKEIQTLRYGENPHQPASWYQTGSIPTGWASAIKLQGKELSYNNLVDLESARRIISEFPNNEPACAILKHNNPCGVAIGNSLVNAYEKAFQADSVSAFGGIVAVNQTLDAETATAMSKTFLECIVAPSCSEEAEAIFSTKSNLRVLILPDLITGPKETIKAIAGGLLVQVHDDIRETPKNWKVVTEKQPTSEQLAELQFAWNVCKHVKSNAIVVSKNRVTLGVGAGQMNRVGSAKIALEQAGESAKSAYLASDGFFPFDDSVRTASQAGIIAIVQPGGSVRDQDSINAANELGLIMVFTGVRHFLH